MQLKKSFDEITVKISLLALLTFVLAFGVGTIHILGSLTDYEKELKARKDLLLKKLNEGTLKIGIQGGKGSFNELALETFFESNPEQPYEVSYLHTTENVLKALDNGEIDRGQFAIKNTLGGEVAESVEAMKKHKFDIICHYDLKVAHTLMMSPMAKIEALDTVVAHPQALKQCKENLKKFPKLKQFSGQGDLVDPSTWAEKLGKGKIGLNHAILGNKNLAGLNHLKIVQENMQDSDNNFTTFVLVKLKD